MSSDSISAIKTTDANGDATFNIPAGTFTTGVTLQATVQMAASSTALDVRIRSATATQVIVRVTQSAGINITLLGLTLLGVPAPVSGATVHLTMTPVDPTIT